MRSVTILRSITNETKLRLVALLLENELCVCELEEITGVRQANISKNLAALRTAGVVDVRRDGQRGFYFLTDEFLDNINFIRHIHDLKLIEPQLIKDHAVFLHHEEVKDGNIYVCMAYRNEAN